MAGPTGGTHVIVTARLKFGFPPFPAQNVGVWNKRYKYSAEGWGVVLKLGRGVN